MKTLRLREATRCAQGHAASMWKFSDSPSRFHFSTLPPMRARTLFISLCPGCPAQDSALKPGLGKCFHIRGLPCRPVSSAQGTASGGGLYQSHPVSEGSGVKGGHAGIPLGAPSANPGLCWQTSGTPRVSLGSHYSGTS